MTKPTYKQYLLTVLLVVLAFSTVDRMALALLLQDIKVDLALSDTQLGFVTGIAFALFYAIMGIPIARWADRGNRITIISLTTAVWSVAVALCSLVGSFPQLVLARIGVAVGEAGCMPPAHSLIADYFTRAERPRAVAIYMLGGPLSVLIGSLAAGWLNEMYGWRTTFVLLGLPGVALAVLVRCTLKEPRLVAPIKTAANPISAPPPPRLKEVCRFLWSNVTFRHIVLCYSIFGFFGSGVAQWKPTFFARTYGMQTGELGTWFALIMGMGTMLGLLGGGELASRFAANNERLQFKLMAIASVGYAVISALIYVVPSRAWAFGFMAIALTGGTLATAPLLAIVQTLLPQRMRATAIAILFLFSNLIGMGLGPLMIGVLSDALRPVFGNDSLRYALLAASPGFVWAAAHMWFASKSVTSDLQAVQLQNDVESVPRDGPDVEQPSVAPPPHARQRSVVS